MADENKEQKGASEEVQAPDPNERVVEQDDVQLSEMQKMMGMRHEPEPLGKGGLSDAELEAALADEDPPVAEEEPAEEPVVEVKPAQKEAVAEEEEEEPDVTPEPADQKDEGEQLGRLQKIINEQAELIAQMQEKQTEQALGQQPKAEESEAEEPAQAAPVQLKDIATDEEFEEALTDATKLKGLFERVVTTVREATMRDVLPIVDQATSRQLTMKEAVSKFWSENKDLSDFSSYVNRLAYEVRSEHPDWAPQQVLDEVATKARTNLGIQKQAAETEKKRQQVEETEESKKPAFARTPKGGSNRQARSDGLTAEQQEMKKMVAATVH